MKTQKIHLPALVLLFMMTIISNESFSTTFNVSASDFSFSPASINVSVGDTVKWTRINGSHTTTCDGTNNTTRPAGAPSWNSPLTSSSPSFTYVITVEGTYHYVCTPHVPSMAGNITAIASSISQLSELVSSYELSQNYPNPFNPVTNINFSIPKSSLVTLKVYNELGQELSTLVNEQLGGGTYNVDWNAVNFPSGVYFYKIEAEGFILTKKMLLTK